MEPICTDVSRLCEANSADASTCRNIDELSICESSPLFCFVEAKENALAIACYAVYAHLAVHPLCHRQLRVHRLYKAMGQSREESIQGRLLSSVVQQYHEG